MPDGERSRRDERSRSAARATGAAPEIPGVPGGAVRDRLRRGVECELGRPSPGDDAEPRGPDAPAEVRVLDTGYPGADQAATELGDLSPQVWGDLLEGERHPGERALVARLQRGREKVADRGPEHRIDLADRAPSGVLDLRRRHVSLPDERRESDGVACCVVVQMHGGAP